MKTTFDLKFYFYQATAIINIRQENKEICNLKKVDQIRSDQIRNQKSKLNKKVVFSVLINQTVIFLRKKLR